MPREKNVLVQIKAIRAIVQGEKQGGKDYIDFNSKFFLLDCLVLFFCRRDW